MKAFPSLFLILLAFTLANCSGSETKAPIPPQSPEPGQLYENEYGEIRVIPENDSMMRTVFKNKEGETFDTLMKIDYDFMLITKRDSLPFLHLKMGGLDLREECLNVHEFSGMTYLALHIRIKEMYNRPFFKTGTRVKFRRDLRYAKGGPRVDGIYLIGYEGGNSGFVEVEGTILKEKYPRAFYSTPESPQGMFGDTNVVHYRLVMRDFEVRDIPKRRFKGNTMNIEGKAAFIWEFARSEAYYLDGREAWKEDELHQPIEIEGVLEQFIDGRSVLKDWRVVD